MVDRCEVNNPALRERWVCHGFIWNVVGVLEDLFTAVR